MHHRKESLMCTDQTLERHTQLLRLRHRHRLHLFRGACQCWLAFLGLHYCTLRPRSCPLLSRNTHMAWGEPPLAHGNVIDFIEPRKATIHRYVTRSRWGPN
ncbi:hypothetical protein CGRA01v4_08596 [Colletotrichum graminicola]|nr:hypothetical protein CGRA01v4_08596 [Colletotrichum graminicola]